MAKKKLGRTAWVGGVVLAAGVLGACMEGMPAVPVAEVAITAPVAPLRPRTPLAMWVDDDVPVFVERDPNSSAVPYDCRGLAPRPAIAARPVRAEIAALVRAVDPSSSRPLDQVGDVAIALASLEALQPTALSVFERVVLQSTALSALTRTGDEAIARVARSVVDRFALPTADLEALGAAPDPAAERWIGDRASWVDRKGEQCGDGRLLQHDRKYRGVRAFLPLRAGETRAIVAQLVAVDTGGQAHVTPFIGEIEVLVGEGDATTTCIVAMDAEGLSRGAPGGLRRADLAHLPQTPFVHSDGGGLFKCNNCHSRGGVGAFADVAAEEAPTLQKNRREATTTLLEQRLHE